MSGSRAVRAVTLAEERVHGPKPWPRTVSLTKWTGFDPPYMVTGGPGGRQHFVEYSTALTIYRFEVREAIIQAMAESLVPTLNKEQ